MIHVHVNLAIGMTIIARILNRPVITGLQI